MFTGQISKSISLIIIVALMNMIMGCNISKPPTSDVPPDGDVYTDNYIESSGFSDNQGFGTLTPNPKQSIEKSFDLPNGTMITITDFDIRNDYYVVRLNYENGTGLVTRDAAISLSFTELHLYDMLGNLLYQYSVDLTDDSTAIKFKFDTQQDQLFITHFANEVRQKYEFMGDIVDVSFADEEQMNHAIWLCQTYTEENKSELSPEDLALYTKIADVSELLSDPNSFENNLDAEISGCLVGYKPFIEWAFSCGVESTYGKLKLPSWFKKLCRFASYAMAISCPFFWTGWGAAICVPATGISITCEVLYWIDDED